MPVRQRAWKTGSSRAPRMDAWSRPNTSSHGSPRPRPATSSATPSRDGCTRSARASCRAGTRARSIHEPPFPLTIVRGEGARLTDADGHEYVDFLGEYTAGLYGHSHPVILGGDPRGARTTASCSARRTAYEAALAEAICARFPSIELVRFTQLRHRGEPARASRWRACDTGAPASWSSRAATTAACSSSRQRRLADQRAVSHSSSAQYNDAEGAARLIAEHARRARGRARRADAGRRAAASPASRRSSRRCARRPPRTACCSIFDEVMTSRLSTGGLQQVLGVDARPDDARQVPRRRARVRRLRRPRRPDGGSTRPARTRSPTPARSTTTC